MARRVNVEGNFDGIRFVDVVRWSSTHAGEKRSVSSVWHVQVDGKPFPPRPQAIERELGANQRAGNPLRRRGLKTLPSKIRLHGLVLREARLTQAHYLREISARSQKDGPTKTVCERSLTLVGNGASNEALSR